MDKGQKESENSNEKNGKTEELFSSEEKSLSHQVMDMLSASSRNDQGEVGSVSLDSVKKMIRASRSVSDQDLHELYIETAQKTPGEKQASAMVYVEAAKKTEKPDEAINKLAAGFLSDEHVARNLKNDYIESQNNAAWNTIASSTGMLSTFASYYGTRAILNGAAKYIPLPAPARGLLAAGTALIAGGMINNAVRGENLLSRTGLQDNALNSGLAYSAGNFLNVVGPRLAVGYPGLVAGINSGIGFLSASEKMDDASRFQNNFDRAAAKAVLFSQGRMPNHTYYQNLDASNLATNLPTKTLEQMFKSRSESMEYMLKKFEPRH